MARTKFKKIPFSFELAKKITNKEVKGRIVTDTTFTRLAITQDRTGATAR